MTETQCEAVCRKSNTRCPHMSRWEIPSLLAGHLVMDRKQFTVYGRPVRLCVGHKLSWGARQRRLLTLKLIDGGYLSAYNRYGYGSIVTEAERIDFTVTAKLAIPKAWGAKKWQGNVPAVVVEALGLQTMEQSR